MLTEQEYQIIKNELSKRFVIIPNDCIIVRVRDIFEILDHFIEERNYGNNRGSEGRQEEVEKEELLEKRTEPIPSGENSGTEPNPSPV